MCLSATGGRTQVWDLGTTPWVYPCCVRFGTSSFTLNLALSRKRVTKMSTAYSELIAASAPAASMTSHYPEPFVDQIYSQLAMPAVSQPADLSFAWALVCILHILASDSLQPCEEQHDTLLVAPPPGLDLPCYAGERGREQPHKVHRCKRHTNW